MNERRSQSSEGFTLLEVLVALAILGVSIGLLFRIFSENLHRTSEFESETTATSLAQSILARVETESLQADGERHGEFRDGLLWRILVEPYGPQDDREAWAFSAKKLTAQVSWRDGGVDRSIVLTTLKLAPKEPPR
jgi:general secretion pathway protein I